MAGKIGAISISPIIPPFMAVTHLFKHSSTLTFKLNPKSSVSLCFRSSLNLRRLSEMAESHSPEIKEPSSKIQKLDHGDTSKTSTSFFKVKKLSDKATLPTRASPLSAGYILFSAFDTKVPARGKQLVLTDLSIAIPEGTYGRIAPRTEMAWQHSIGIGAGVIDADYRGPVGVVLFNHSDVEFVVKKGARIAQLIIEKIITPEVLEVKDLDATLRGESGFGSTGV